MVVSNPPSIPILTTFSTVAFLAGSIRAAGISASLLQEFFEPAPLNLQKRRSQRKTGPSAQSPPFRNGSRRLDGTARLNSPRAVGHFFLPRPVPQSQAFSANAGTGRNKYASTHDARRAFGKVIPSILQQLMGHSSIDTTLRFYVGKNANTAVPRCGSPLEGRKVTLLETGPTKSHHGTDASVVAR
jgi:hypothetical protein